VMIWMIERGLISPLCTAMESNNHEVLKTCLKIVKLMLEAFKEENLEKSLLTQFEEIGITKRIESLQAHEASDIYKLAFCILDTYYDSALGF
jgi:flagellar motor component MotA